MTEELLTMLRADFDRVWHWLEAALVQDIGGASHSKEEMWDLITEGRVMLFVGSRSAFIVEFIIHPHSKRANIWIGGGDMKQMLEELLPKLEEWARANGFDHIQSSGRAAWGRVAGKYGFKQTHVTFAKEL